MNVFLRICFMCFMCYAFSTLMLLVGRQEGIRPVKNEWWGAGMVICLERDADLHMAQLMPLPLTVSCFSKIQIGFTFLVLAHPGSPWKRAVKRVCVCVCVFFLVNLGWLVPPQFCPGPLIQKRTFGDKWHNFCRLNAIYVTETYIVQCQITERNWRKER